MNEQKECIKVKLTCGVDYYKGEKPVKGVDYFTEEDIREIADYIENMDIDLSSYATKAELAEAIENIEETDPTVPKWAKQPNKPTYTASEVGALPDDTYLFSGDYNDLRNKPTIPDVDVDDSFKEIWDALDNNYATKDYVDNAIDNIPAPPTYDSGYGIEINAGVINVDSGVIASHNWVDDEIFATVPTWAMQHSKPEYTAQEVGALPANTQLFSGNYNDLTNKPTIPTVPTNVSAFTNDAGYLTSHQSLTDYATKNYVEQVVAGIETGALKRSVVQALPTESIDSDTIYMVSRTNSETNNVYDEYLYVNNTWEKIGSTDVDLSDYALKSELPEQPILVELSTNRDLTADEIAIINGIRAGTISADDYQFIIDGNEINKVNVGASGPDGVWSSSLLFPEGSEPVVFIFDSYKTHKLYNALQRAYDANNTSTTVSNSAYTYFPNSTRLNYRITGGNNFGSQIGIDSNSVLVDKSYTDNASSSSGTLSGALAYFNNLISSKANSSALNNKQDVLTFNTAYNASTNPVATMADIPAPYTLPTASTSTLGGVKIDGSTITIDSNGVISASTTSGSEYTAGAGIEIDSNNVISKIPFSLATITMYQHTAPSSDTQFTPYAPIYQTGPYNDPTTQKATIVEKLKQGYICYCRHSSGYAGSANITLEDLTGVSGGLPYIDFSAFTNGVMYVSTANGGWTVSSQKYFYWDGKVFYIWGDFGEITRNIKVKYGSNTGYLGTVLNNLDAKVPAVPSTDGNYKLTTSISSGTATTEWVEDSGSGGGSSYTAGDGISIDNNNVISKTPNLSSILGLLFAIEAGNTGIYNANAWINTLIPNGSINNQTVREKHIHNLKTLGMTYLTQGLVSDATYLKEIIQAVGGDDTTTNLPMVQASNAIDNQYTMGMGLYSFGYTYMDMLGFMNKPVLIIFNGAESKGSNYRWYFIANPEKVFQNKYFNSVQGLTSHSIPQAIDEVASSVSSKFTAPTAPSTDGTYFLTTTISSGTATYSWENVVIGGSY